MMAFEGDIFNFRFAFFISIYKKLINICKKIKKQLPLVYKQ